MKILIAGASGFISSYVMDKAVARGYDVVAMGRSMKKGQESIMQKGPVVSADPGELHDHH